MSNTARFPLRWHLVALGGWVIWMTAHLLPRPLLVDEVAFASWAAAPFAPYPHPPLYMWALAALHYGLRVPPYLLRCVGIVAIGLSAVAAYQLAERWERGAGRWTLWLLLTNPLLLQGAMVLDIDNTILTWWLTISVWWMSRVAWPLSRRLVIVMGFWWALGLWMKLTTPLLWPGALWVVYAARGQGRRGLNDVAMMSAVGLVAFLAVWTLYSGLVGISWPRVFMGRTVDVLLRGPTNFDSSMTKELASRAVRIGLWIGPIALGLWVVATVHVARTWKQFQAREALVLAMVMGWAVLAGYWFVGGVNWSFAKYHCPFIPLLAAVSGAAVARVTRRCRLSGVLLAGLAGVMALWSGRVVGDLLYLVNHTLRHASMFAPERLSQETHTLLVRLVWMIGGAGGIAIILWRFRARLQLTRVGAVSVALALGAIGSNLGLTALQAGAPYSTAYCYGRSWATDRATIQSIKTFVHEHPAARLLVPETAYALATGLSCEQQPTCTLWTGFETPQSLAAALRQLDYVLIDPDYNYARLFRAVLPAAEVMAVLQADFESSAVGTATAWTRRSLPPPLHGGRV